MGKPPEQTSQIPIELINRHGQTVSPLAIKEIKIKAMIKYYITLVKIPNILSAGVRLVKKSLLHSVADMAKEYKPFGKNLTTCI